MRRVNVMILDDSELELGLALDVLTHESFIGKISCFTDADEAREFFKDHRPEMILVDFNMNAQDGINFIESLGDARHETVTVILSGDKDFRKIEKARNLNVSAWIDKPIDSSRLLEVVKQVPELGWCMLKGDRVA